jgi:hypothetical protein
MKSIIKLLSASAFVLVLNSCGGVPEEKTAVAGEEKVFAVEEVLEMVAKENDVTRTLYTKAIVGGGKKQGMKFDEDWRKDDVEAGPLPALFLRGVATSIRKSPVPLGLYLGSDFPVNAANKFEGKQAELFTQIKEDQKPQFFYDEDQKLHTAMFADLASAGACVSCHNDVDFETGDNHRGIVPESDASCSGCHGAGSLSPMEAHAVGARGALKDGVVFDVMSAEVAADQLTVVSYGEEKPMVKDRSEEAF